VNPNNQPTVYRFMYGTESSLGSYSSSPPLEAGAGKEYEPVQYALDGLEPGTTYYFLLDAVNGAGPGRSPIASFTTSSPGLRPAVTTLDATQVSGTSAVLNGNVTPNGSAASAWFEWGTDPALSVHGTTGSQSVGSGTTSLLVTVPLYGLPAGTPCYYRVVAGNSAGTSLGEIRSFTPGAAPAVTTLPATSVSTNAATLNGNVNPNGIATSARFEWGTDPTLIAYTSTPIQAGLNGTSPVPVHGDLTALDAGETYYYRVVASNSFGSAVGTIGSFHTPSGPSVFSDSFSTDTTVRAGGIPTTDPYTIDWYATTGGYTVRVYASVTDWVPGVDEGMGYRADLLAAQARMSVNHGVTISHSVPSCSRGSFSMDFSPIQGYGEGAGIAFRLRQDGGTYYEISNGVNDGWGGMPSVKKVVSGTVVYQKQYTNYYSQGGGNTNYLIQFTFTPTQTAWDAFGFTDVHNEPGGSSITVRTLELDYWQQDAIIDNVRLQAAP
jgi:hypothetical protein